MHFFAKFLLCLALFLKLPAFAQDSLKYDYADLIVMENDPILKVRYSDGTSEFLIKTLQLKADADVEERFSNIFKCLNYLNQKGFELVTESSYNLGTGMYARFQKEFIFKRKKSY